MLWLKYGDIKMTVLIKNHMPLNNECLSLSSFMNPTTYQLKRRSRHAVNESHSLRRVNYDDLIKGNERHKEILVEKNIISRGRGGFGQKSLLVFAENFSLFKGRLSFFPILSSSLYKKNQLKT